MQIFTNTITYTEKDWVGRPPKENGEGLDTFLHAKIKSEAAVYSYQCVY